MWKIKHLFMNAAGEGGKVAALVTVAIQAPAMAAALLC